MPDADYRKLLSAKAERLEDLRKRKPGQKNYKRSLKAFLEADAEAEKALLRQIDRSFAPAAEAGDAAGRLQA